MERKTDQTEGWFAVATAILVLFTAMMDARISVVLSVVLLLGFAGYQLLRNRRA